jgi:hypothetical protein
MNPPAHLLKKQQLLPDVGDDTLDADAIASLSTSNSSEDS